MRTSKLAWALTLGLALALTAGAVSLVAPSGGRPETAQTQANAADAAAATAAVDAPPTNFVDPWPTDTSTVTVDPSDTETTTTGGGATIVLAARWGYVDDPAVAFLEGRWRFNDTSTGGAFLGQWHLVNGRAGGYLDGRFTLPHDGHGRFRGEWNIAGSRIGGYLWGAWVRLNDTSGYFDGQWNFTSGRDGGALGGRWAQAPERNGAGGGFRGMMIAAPSMRPVNWDGPLSTTNGSVRLLRTVRFERNDRVLPQTNRTELDWQSTTTVNWDGIITVLHIADPSAQVTLHTTQASFTWTARELPGLHVRQVVDRDGHAIEVAAFLYPRPCECAKFAIGVRWGNLSSDGNGTGGPGTSFNGFAQITYGGIEVGRILSFERADGDLLLPRDNRVTVSWTSNTDAGDWDGLLLGAIVPTRALNVTYFTVHAGDFTHVFTLRQLLGDHVFDVGNGNAVEVRAARL